MKTTGLAIAGAAMALCVSGCAGNSSVTAKLLDCDEIQAPKLVEVELRQNPGWNPPDYYVCDPTTCRHTTPGQFSTSVVVNNSETAPRMVQLSVEQQLDPSQQLVIQVPPGDSVHPGPTIQGMGCPAPDDFPITVTFLTS